MGKEIQGGTLLCQQDVWVGVISLNESTIKHTGRLLRKKNNTRNCYMTLYHPMP